MLSQKLLGGHCYDYWNNRGAKDNLVTEISELASVENLVPGLKDLTCSNQPSYKQLRKKHGTKHIPSVNHKMKQRKN